MGADHQIAFFLRESAAPDPARRAAAVKGLGRTGGAGYVRVLTEAARDPAPPVRAAAARELGRLGDPAAGAEVLLPLMADADPHVRRRASVAAIRRGLEGPAVTQAFARLLSDPDHHLRIIALDGLAALGVPGTSRPWSGCSVTRTPPCGGAPGASCTGSGTTRLCGRR